MADSQLTGPIPSAEPILDRTRTYRWPRRWWLHALIFGVTILTTTAFGVPVAESFAAGQQLSADRLFDGYARLIHLDASFWIGLLFSAPLLTILGAHELGHYFACKYWQVEASLPYFLPSPTLLGTFGAFMHIRSPIYTRRSLMDIGISGPIAGFVVLLPFLFFGISMSRVTYTAPHQDSFLFGTPLALRLAEWMHFGGTAPAHILVHPMAMAAWAGLLATAINLLPLGQLDGGHIVYAVLGERSHYVLSTAFVLLLVLFGFLYWAWWGWAILMFFFGRRHPLVYDQIPLGSSRVMLGVVAILLLVISISIVPVSTT